MGKKTGIFCLEKMEKNWNKFVELGCELTGLVGNNSKEKIFFPLFYSFETNEIETSTVWFGSLHIEKKPYQKKCISEHCLANCVQLIPSQMYKSH